MSDLPAEVKKAHFKAHRQAKPARQLIPDKNGILQEMEFDKERTVFVPATNRTKTSKSKAKKQAGVVRAGEASRLAELKVLDIIAFNSRAEEFFVIWLSDILRAKGKDGVGVGWLYSNAAFELDISIETVKRYLAKHTADRAEFRIEKGTIHLK